MSEMKLVQVVVHSCLTIEISVAFSLVSRCWLCWLSASSSDSFNTSWMMKFRIPCFCSSGKICHRVCPINILFEAYVDGLVEDLEGEELGVGVGGVLEDLVDHEPGVGVGFELVEDLVGEDAL